MPNNLIDRLDNYLKNRKQRKVREHHYPSDANSCIRQLYYKWLGVEESNPSDPGNLYKMEMGNAIHELLFKFLKESGLVIADEIPFKYKDPGLKYEISGRIDNIFVDDNGMASGIEIKSSYGQGIKYIQKNNKPKEEHLIQVAMYLHFTNINRFYLFYLGRDNAYRTQFVFDKDNINIDINKIIEHFKKLEKHLDNKEIPDREYEVIIKNGEIKDRIQKNKKVYKSDWQCLYCNYKDLCWKKELEKKVDKLELF